jgi:hypothetical protein
MPRLIASQVYVSPFADCSGAAQLPSVETCFNLQENGVVTDVRNLRILLRMRALTSPPVLYLLLHVNARSWDGHLGTSSLLFLLPAHSAC